MTRRFPLLAIGAFCAGAGLLHAATEPAQPSPQPAWTDHAPDRPRASRADIAIPREGGSLRMTETKDFGAEGLDNYAEYESGDQAISGTIYIYFPALADTGLTFLATDATIRRRFGPGTVVAQDTLVPVGGVPNAGRRIIYEGASDGRRSTTAMFLRAGGWIVVLRVSGPHSRAAEIAGDLDALAAGLGFPGKNKPVPAHVIATEDCAAAPPEQDASVSKPTGGQATMLLLMVATNELRDPKGKPVADVRGRIPDRLCLARSGMRGEAVLLTYRTVSKPTGLFVPRLFQIVGDGGFMLEVTALSNEPNQIVVVRHAVGKLSAYGLFTTVPSAAQLERVIEQEDSIPLIGRAILKPEGGTDIHLDCSQFREGCGKLDDPATKSAAPAHAPAASSR